MSNIIRFQPNPQPTDGAYILESDNGAISWVDATQVSDDGIYVVEINNNTKTISQSADADNISY